MKNLREFLARAEERGVAIGHFNISDSEGFKAVIEESKKLSEESGEEIPVIIGVSEGEREFIGLDEAVSLVKTARSNGLPVFINADHTYSVDKAKRAIDAGVDSVIVDAAEKNFDENVSMTKEIVDYARSKNSEILVEGELGFIGKSSKVIENLPNNVSPETQTDPEEARKFVEATGVNLLAPSVGNVHGIIKTGNPKLNIERITLLKKTVGVPLVLHGGSGISDKDFRDAINAGIRIIHINTELRLAYREGVEEGLKTGDVAPYKFLAQGVEHMRKVVRERLKLFNNL